MANGERKRKLSTGQLARAAKFVVAELKGGSRRSRDQLFAIGANKAREDHLDEDGKPYETA
jgi:hypothetical protein